MVPFPILRFADSAGNIVTYTFDPLMRDEAGDGPVSLQRTSRKLGDPEVGSEGPAIVVSEPRPGDEFYRYFAEDGADVRYQYDPGSRNGKDYVVAIHRTPENWKRLMEENLGVKAEKEKAKDRYAQSQGQSNPMGAGMKPEGTYEQRRDSGMYAY